MRSIFRYPGSKSRKSICDWILSYKPRLRSYREAMVGGGGVFFNMEGTRWVNDLNPGLIGTYKSLRDRSKEFIKKCRAITPRSDDTNDTMVPGKSGGRPKSLRLQKKFDYFKKNPKDELSYFFINRTSFAGRVDYNRPTRVYFSNPEGWNIVNTNRLEQAATHLQGVTITCKPYQYVLNRPGVDVWIYIDPPYVVNTGLKGDQLYEHNFTIEDHEQLVKDVENCNHKVAISYDDHPLIRELYKGWRIEENSWTYMGTSKRSKGSELLIMNY